MRRVVLKSPVLENCTPGSVRGAPGNRRPYLAMRDAETPGKATQSHRKAIDSGVQSHHKPECRGKTWRKQVRTVSAALAQG